MIVELRGLRLFGYHGAYAEEKERGQPFLFDIELDVGERGADDRLESAVDYAEVAKAVAQLSDGHRFDLLEALASAVADELFSRFDARRVRVRVRKPEVRPAGFEVEYSAVTAERP